VILVIHSDLDSVDEDVFILVDLYSINDSRIKSQPPSRPMGLIHDTSQGHIGKTGEKGIKNPPTMKVSTAPKI
jgi:hypothetical protein